MEQQYNPIIHDHKRRFRQSFPINSNDRLSLNIAAKMKIQLPIIDRQNPKIKLNIKRQKNPSNKKNTHLQYISLERPKQALDQQTIIQKDLGKQNQVKPAKFIYKITSQQDMQVGNRRKVEKKATLKLQERSRSKQHLWINSSQIGQKQYEIHSKRKLQMELLDKSIANEGLKQQLNVLEEQLRKISEKKKKMNLNYCSNLLDVKLQPIKTQKISVNISQQDQQSQSLTDSKSCIEKISKSSIRTQIQKCINHLVVLPKRTMFSKGQVRRNRQLSLCINQNQRQSKRLNFLMLQKPKKKITKAFDYFCSSQSNFLEKKKIQKLELIKRTITHKFKANRYSFQQLQNQFLQASNSFITVFNLKQLLQQFPFFLLKNCVDFLIEYCFGKELLPHDQIQYSILAVKLRQFIEDYSVVSEEQQIILNEKMKKILTVNMGQIVEYLSKNQNRIGQITEYKFNSILKNFHLSSKQIQFIISQSVLASPDADHILYQKFLQNIAKSKAQW